MYVFINTYIRSVSAILLDQREKYDSSHLQIDLREEMSWMCYKGVKREH